MSESAAQTAIVFGAGEAGRRALACLRRDPSCHVIAFADNAVARHGALFHGVRIVPPASLERSNASRIVIASHAAHEILPQLRALGIPHDRIAVYRPGDDSIDAVPEEAHGWPRILVLTDECISPSHGTGAVLLRHFAGYPRERLLHAYLRQRGDAFLPHSFKVARAADVERAAGGGAAETLPVTPVELVEDLLAAHGPIDLVYSNVYGETGLIVLRELLAALPASVPVIHHAHDLLTENDASFDAALRALSPRLTELWAIGPGLAERLREATGRPAALMNTFCCPITPTFKREHREATPAFRAVMLGNSHMPWVLDHLRACWSKIRREFGVGPIQWFAYPTSVLGVERAGVRIEPDIEYYGYLSDRVLHAHLCAADLAIVPFNVADEPEQGYARYSVPSRLTELVNAGLPIFAAAGRNTETRRFIEHHGIGRCATLANQDQFTRDLRDIVLDVGARESLGRASRSFAVEQCDITRYRERLFDRIGGLTGFDLSPRLQCAS